MDTSTTVVTEREWPSGACSGSDEREPDERGGRKTRPDGKETRADGRAREPRRGVALRPDSMGRGWANQPPLSFEVREALGGRLGWGGVARFFFQACRGGGKISLAVCSQDAQKGMGQHREGDMAIPSLEGTHFILIQTDLSFGFLKALLDRPAAANGDHHLPERGLSRSKDQKVGHLSRLGPFRQAASDDQPAFPAGLLCPTELSLGPLEEALH